MKSSQEKPKVSILCITYNQQSYISQTLDSFLSQQTDFRFEVLIHDDASTDGTTDIIKDYAAKFPDVIKPIYEDVNQYSLGKFDFIWEMYRQAKGDYIATCEGDDYWTDNSKLQRQVALMDSTPDLALCFHPVKVVFENGNEADSVFPVDRNRRDFNLGNLLKSNFIQTNSVMYRRRAIYDDVLVGALPGDWYTHLYHAQFGKIGFINEVMSVYRRHDGGVWWDGEGRSDGMWARTGSARVALFGELLRMFGDNKSYRTTIVEHIYSIVEILASVDGRSGPNVLRQAIVLSPDVIEEYVKESIRRLGSAHADIKHLVSEIDGLKDREVAIRKDIKSYEREIESIKNSKLWRAGEAWRGIKNKLGL